MICTRRMRIQLCRCMLTLRLDETLRLSKGQDHVQDKSTISSSISFIFWTVVIISWSQSRLVLVLLVDSPTQRRLATNIQSPPTISSSAQLFLHIHHCLVHPPHSLKSLSLFTLVVGVVLVSFTDILSFSIYSVLRKPLSVIYQCAAPVHRGSERSCQTTKCVLSLSCHRCPTHCCWHL
jgi:hypothetical protein